MPVTCMDPTDASKNDLINVLALGVLIRQALRENELNPVMTSISSQATSKAHFPSISIDGGQSYDPMGFVRKALNRYHPTSDTEKRRKSSTLSSN